MAFQFLIYFSIFIYTVGLFFAFLFYRNPPKDINAKYGYKTGLSMKNIDNWTYANKIAPLIMIKSLLIGLSLLLLFLYCFKENLTLETTPILVLLYVVFNSISIVFIVEGKLNNYDKFNSKK